MGITRCRLTIKDAVLENRRFGLFSSSSTFCFCPYPRSLLLFFVCVPREDIDQEVGEREKKEVHQMRVFLFECICVLRASLPSSSCIPLPVMDTFNWSCMPFLSLNCPSGYALISKWVTCRQHSLLLSATTHAILCVHVYLCFPFLLPEPAGYSSVESGYVLCNESYDGGGESREGLRSKQTITRRFSLPHLGNDGTGLPGCGRRQGVLEFADRHTDRGSLGRLIQLVVSDKETQLVLHTQRWSSVLGSGLQGD